jgi:hypothetical protein
MANWGAGGGEREVDCIERVTAIGHVYLRALELSALGPSCNGLSQNFAKVNRERR